MKRFSMAQVPASNPASATETHATDVAESVARVETDIRAVMRKLGETEFSLAQAEERSRGKTAKLLLSLLDVLDSFQRVFDAVHEREELVTPQMKKWLANFRTIQRMLRQALTDQGVTRIENLDQGFDPNWHIVYETVDDPTREEGTVLNEAKPGYLWSGSILRKAEVVVVHHGLASDGTA